MPCVSRCGGAGVELLHGAPNRRGGSREGHRSPRSEKAKPRAAERDPVEGGLRHDVRQRRLPGGVREGGQGGRWFRATERRIQKARTASRARRRQLPDRKSVV